MEFSRRIPQCAAILSYRRENDFAIHPKVGRRILQRVAVSSYRLENEVAIILEFSRLPADAASLPNIYWVPEMSQMADADAENQR